MKNIPDFVKNNNDMNSLYDVQQSEIDLLNNSIDSVINNLFISSSDIDGVRRYEKFFNIKVNALYTLEERKIYPDEFKIIIDIDTNNPVIYLQFSKQVRNIIPANLYLILSIQYTYIYLKRNYTYGKLSALTYEELSRYSELNEE